MEKEIISRAYIPVYILEKEELGHPWYQLYITEDCYGQVEAKWVYDSSAGMEYHGEMLSPLLEQDSHDAHCVRRPIVIEKFTNDPSVLQGIVGKLTF